MHPHLTPEMRERSKIHLSDKQLVGIGHVAIRSGTLDQLIERAVDHFTRWDMRPSARNAVLDFTTSKKIEFFREWVAHEVGAINRPLCEISLGASMPLGLSATV